MAFDDGATPRAVNSSMPKRCVNKPRRARTRLSSQTAVGRSEVPHQRHVEQQVRHQLQQHADALDTIDRMQVAAGTVVDGKVVIEGLPLAEVAIVAVIARGADESFSLTEQQENELLAAMAEIDRGECETLEDLLRSLPKQG